MGRIKKYHTKEERVAARKRATAKYYESNKEEKNKKDLLRYYQHKVKDLLILSSASLQSPDVTILPSNTTIYDCPVNISKDGNYPITGSSDFQLTAFSFVDNPIDDFIFPNTNITVSYDNSSLGINSTGSVGMPCLKTDYQLDISGNVGDSSSSFQSAAY